MIQAEHFLEELHEKGYTFFSGVPCSFLKPFINAVINSETLDYIGATSEGEAVGITLGAYLAGRKTVTMCQNSGLGNMVNPLTSLNHPFKIPTLLVTTWRGEPGFKDEPQHALMGGITHSLLETLKIPWSPFPANAEDVSRVVDMVDASMRSTDVPYALVMSKGAIAPLALESVPATARVAVYSKVLGFNQSAKRPSRTEAIGCVLSQSSDSDAIIATTGKTGRELFTLDDREGNFYVVGGMGTAASIGLGVCAALPDQRVIVLDGDGAALMKLGALATIGQYQPSNLLHLIFDNECHDSTGGQATASAEFTQVAAATHYRNVYSAETCQQLNDALNDSSERVGPTMIHVKIKPGSPTDLGRPTVTPEQVKQRFMQFLSNQS